MSVKDRLRPKNIGPRKHLGPFFNLLSNRCHIKEGRYLSACLRADRRVEIQTDLELKHLGA